MSTVVHANGLLVVSSLYVVEPITMVTHAIVLLLKFMVHPAPATQHSPPPPPPPHTKTEKLHPEHKKVLLTINISHESSVEGYQRTWLLQPTEGSRRAVEIGRLKTHLQRTVVVCEVILEVRTPFVVDSKRESGWVRVCEIWSTPGF